MGQLLTQLNKYQPTLLALLVWGHHSQVKREERKRSKEREEREERTYGTENAFLCLNYCRVSLSCSLRERTMMLIYCTYVCELWCACMCLL